MRLTHEAGFISDNEHRSTKVVATLQLDCKSTIEVFLELRGPGLGNTTESSRSEPQ